ncbi:MAG: hypothetical protein N2Z22_06410 [Turneriella sp.]|nr:hypothetical protein [Turneriella sp.]
MNVRLASLLALLLCTLSCQEETVIQHTRHEEAASAYFLQAGRPVRGHFSSAKDFYLRFAMQESGMFRAELSPVPTADLSLALLDASGQLLLFVDDNPQNAGEEIPPVFLERGEYFIRIRGGTSGHNFRFFYRTFRAPGNVEQEPNNELQTANPVPANHATAFHGPRYFHHAGTKSPERDCFSFRLQRKRKAEGIISVSPVDGYLARVEVLLPDGSKLLETKATKPGAQLRTAPFVLPQQDVLYACVSAERITQDPSRDYYELHFEEHELNLAEEQEPNDSTASANEITGTMVSGAIQNSRDQDFWVWQNRLDYAVVVRAELLAKKVEWIDFVAGTSRLRRYSGTALSSEVADNIRLEAGEKVFFGMRCGKKCPQKGQKGFQAIEYSLQLAVAPASDDYEAEPNDSVEQAEILVDHAQKWGYVSPTEDKDFFRLQLANPQQRSVLVESHHACVLELEHRRNGKSLAVTKIKQRALYNAEFHPGDILSLRCIKPLPAADRSYRLALDAD